MPQLPSKTTKKEEREKLIFLSKQVCQKMDVIPLIDMTIFKKFNEYVDSICNFTDQFKISEFTKNIFDIGETVKKLNSPSINYLPPSNYSHININNHKDIKELEDKIDDLKKEIALYESKENNFSIKINSTGNFFYKDKRLCIGTNSNPGKFFKYLLEDKNNFIPDDYCTNELKCGEVKDLKRDLNNKYLKKDDLKAILKRSGDGNGYILTEIIELGSL